MLDLLAELLARYNVRHFGGRLAVRPIELGEPSAIIRLDCLGVYIGGNPGRIILDRRLTDGTCPQLAGGNGDRIGADRFAADLLLHEMVHAEEYEVFGQFPGHGPMFLAICRRLTIALDAGAVGVLTAGNCHEWPHLIRPAGHYRGAVTAPYHTVSAQPWQRIAGPWEFQNLLQNKGD